MTSISFYGAAGTVTGSCSLVEAGGARFLIDCGMFQGNKSVRALNEQDLPFAARDVDFVVLTHAHIDHSGLLPKLTKHGYRGRVYCTEPTADLLEFMLRDSANIQNSDAERKNRKLRRAGKPDIEPVYSLRDAEKLLGQLKTADYEEWFAPHDGIEVRFWNAGHMLGSASAEIKITENGSAHKLRMLFSGDIGPEEKAFHPEPDAPEGFDYLICESTYGDRERDAYTLAERRAALRKELTDGLSRGGNIVIPSFAVERSQELLHDIGVLLAKGEIPPATVFLDSPLARRVTQVFVKHAHTLDDIELDEAQLFRDENFRIVETVEQSKAINRIRGGAIIISASGMADAGRILHHLKNNIWRQECTVLFVGYQAPGTLGHVITSGKREVRIHGKTFKVKATVRRIGNYSAHADQSELVDWILERAPVVGGLFLNHGEQDAREELRSILAKRGVAEERIFLPQFDERFELEAGTAQSKGRAAHRIDDEALERDWYNDYAAFIIDMAGKLETMPDGEARRALIKRLERALAE